ncbi:PEGA domain-containing protein [Haliangium sp.]|uniref:PEGA domain-containing protein n=1 Tax=Haliangium sp. TaxID=2663208 RepID=UPI003D0A48B4
MSVLRQNSSALPSSPRRLLLYGLGFVLLTNAFVLAFLWGRAGRGPATASAEPGASLPGGLIVERLANLDEVADVVEEAAAPARYSVRVTSSPEGATVRYDGAERGVTPVDVDVAADGPQEIEVSMPGFLPQTVAVEPEQAELAVTLDPDGLELEPAPEEVTEPATRPARSGRPKRAGSGRRGVRQVTRKPPDGRRIRRRAGPGQGAKPSTEPAPAATAEPVRKPAPAPAADEPGSDNPNPWNAPTPRKRERRRSDNPDPWSQ